MLQIFSEASVKFHDIRRVRPSAYITGSVCVRVCMCVCVYVYVCVHMWQITGEKLKLQHG